MTVEEIIDEARDFHNSFSPEDHLEKPVGRALFRAQERFFRDVAKFAESALALDVVFDDGDIEDALAGDPLDLPPFIKLVSVLVATEEGISPVTVYQDERGAAPATFRARLSGRQLYLAQPFDLQIELPESQQQELADRSAFKDAYALRVSYVPLPETPEEIDPGADLEAPNEAREYLVGSLVEFMVRHSPAVSRGERTELLDEAREAKATVLELFAGRDANETSWYVSQVG